MQNEECKMQNATSTMTIAGPLDSPPCQKDEGRDSASHPAPRTHFFILHSTFFIAQARSA
jgi:hypothetical protein